MGWRHISILSCGEMIGHSQFLIRMTSSISPSYVSWVSSGVIISTRRSIMMSASNASETSSKLSRSALVRCVVWSASKSANRYEESDDVTL